MEIVWTKFAKITYLETLENQKTRWAKDNGKSGKNYHLAIFCEFME